MSGFLLNKIPETLFLGNREAQLNPFGYEYRPDFFRLNLKPKGKRIVEKPSVFISVFIIAVLLLLPSIVFAKNELFYNKKMAACLNGKTETRIYYERGSFVLVDIETTTYLIEAGLDNKRSSLDSVQQAAFFHIHKPNKKPMIIIYDTDNKRGVFERQISSVSKRYNIEYKRIPTAILDKGDCP